MKENTEYINHVFLFLKILLLLQDQPSTQDPACCPKIVAISELVRCFVNNISLASSV